MVIAVGFTTLGFWPILPFAGAELVAFGAALHIGAHRTYRGEIVVVDEHSVAVEKGRLIYNALGSLPVLGPKLFCLYRRWSGIRASRRCARMAVR